MKEKKRAKRNKTLEILPEEKEKLSEFFIPVSAFDSSGICDIQNKIIHGDTFQALPHLPEKFADLLFLDPPYNLTKDFDGEIFRQRKSVNYEKWFSDIFEKLLPLLKPEASVYVCADWKSSCEIYNVISKHLTVRNRITWEREKGRGSLTNWKNCSEDIWFATVSNKYKFHPERVKLKRRVIAPYKENGKPKDWEDNESGKFRLTFPSNFWNDITVPFWSMSENTDHPTQKPEKLLAKLILASTEPGDTVFDPFLGSGSSAVTAKKLGRNYTGIESQINYCLFAAKRLKMAELDPSIQGYNGVFKERNAKE